ncbi:beta-carotene hydroxylase [Sphingomonas parva]|uniref:Beta-carotene hydroxylase n=1 Tax=Sphingomonas parva TaxID=2555898 RepID=A0A4Y8ZT73_9SPHN|nr:fatty acid desaturase [Sphingomonas parva]TFI57959.1 beta-carotene hydroxylase [Sphingomonas parva]
MSAQPLETVAGRAADAAPEVRTPAAGPARDERRQLLLREREIAARHMGVPMWGYSVAALGGFALWVALFPLAMAGIIPLWLGFLVSATLATGGYVTSHEAMHSNIARKGEPLRWLNELVGQVSTIPLIFPFSMARIMHLQHHYHCNDPLRDPDYPDEAPSAWQAIVKTWLNRQPRNGGSIHHYKRILAELDSPASRRAQRDTALLQLGAMAFFFAMAWSGYALVIAAIWWLPRHIALSYIRFYLSWAPHHPRTKQGRYENTKVFKSRLGHIMSMGMETHLVHHLYPSIPNHRTKAAYFEMRDVLAARGIDVSPL